MDYLSEQLFFTTADDERNYFTGEQQAPPPKFNPNTILPPGNYRVVDGCLYRVVDWVPSKFTYVEK